MQFRKDRPGEGMVEQLTIEPYPEIETIFTRLQEPDDPYVVETEIKYEKRIPTMEGKVLTADISRGCAPEEPTQMSHLETYISNALRTESEPQFLDGIAETLEDGELAIIGRTKVRLIHAAMGMASEINELIEATDSVNLLEELGDVMWYWAVAVHALGHPPHQVLMLAERIEKPEEGNAREDLFVAIGELNDMAKKHAFYDKSLGNSMLVLARILWLVEFLVQASGESLEYVMDRNIAKLKARYPEKFTKDAALNRDLEKEREALENG